MNRLASLKLVFIVQLSYDQMECANRGKSGGRHTILIGYVMWKFLLKNLLFPLYLKKHFRDVNDGLPSESFC
jgi:hypothetical protein